MLFVEGGGGCLGDIDFVGVVGFDCYIFVGMV